MSRNPTDARTYREQIVTGAAGASSNFVNEPGNPGANKRYRIWAWGVSGDSTFTGSGHFRFGYFSGGYVALIDTAIVAGGGRAMHLVFPGGFAMPTSEEMDIRVVCSAAAQPVQTFVMYTIEQAT